ncbi:SAM-dependent methyltransferase [Nonomuraea sp. NN258]|uniref:SAM-dependent methyltransferase n=1 Tax=Nonomuraea antri TaxID=2730852 RepID=UPI001567EFE9|nr:SAM-dependent methyltransferase [Nonomuraea antri]NRQ33187.1 SAM-dependent methyltransferase [Nonomuraea antri]
MAVTESGNFDPNIPNVARMYDYFLGGKDNFPADRAAAERVLTIVPEIPVGARENRAFLGRAVRFLAESGVRQFLDIGTGLPTQENVHQVVESVAPDARTVYVDNDPQVLTHARALLTNSTNVRIIEGDLRRPAEILRHPEVGGHLDLSRPVAVLLLAIVHFIEEDPRPIIAELLEPLAPGSWLVLSHVCIDIKPEAAPGVERIYQGASAGFVGRRSDEIMSFFDALDVVPPGVVNLPEWRPELPELIPFPDAPPYFLCGVARKP